MALRKPESSEDLDLASLEINAKAQAKKKVANLLQRPDQLDKVEQIRKRNSRKKASVEAQLKTAVQSQLDGVRTGLTQLQNALKDIQEIKEGLNRIDRTYNSISTLGDILAPVREENTTHSQLAAAVENLKHIFTVPETVKRCEDLIADDKLLHAHKCLTDLESSRDDLLYELHKQQNPSPTDKNTVDQYFSQVEKLSVALSKQLWLVLQRTFMTVRREPTKIVTVLRIIEREEKTDGMMLRRFDQTDFLPPGRPKRWRQRAFHVLEEAVSARIEGNQMEDRSMDKMWLVRHLEVTRQIVVDDLRVARTLCEACFPPNYDIANKYVEMYHNAISQHLVDIVEQGLEGNEIISLLTWIHEYSSQDMMGNRELKISTADLAPLLEPKVIADLKQEYKKIAEFFRRQIMAFTYKKIPEFFRRRIMALAEVCALGVLLFCNFARYLKILSQNIEEWMKNSLISDMKDWIKTSPPDSDEKGYFFTSLPVILLQMIEQNIAVASTISEDLTQAAFGCIVDELSKFIITYKSELQVYREKHLANRSEPQFFVHYVIANTNNCQTLSVLMMKLCEKHLGSGEGTGVKRWNIVADQFDRLGLELCEYLIELVMLDLGDHLKDLITRNWLNSPKPVDTICATVEDYCHDFTHIKPKFHTRLLEKIQMRVAKEYLKSMFSRKISYKNYDERGPASEKIVMEGEQLQRLFAKLLPNYSARDSPFAALPGLAEMIKLRDTTIMSLEISDFVKKYPDVRMEQLGNLLMMRGDLGRNDARVIVEDCLGQDHDQKPKEKKTIFSELYH